MIIENQAMVTDAVLEAVSRTEDPRLREILQALVRHLHGFVREISLTEREFQEAVRIVAAMGQKTTPSHNEVALMAGSLGVSPLVCLLNNGNNGQTETQANMLGPFWRDDQPLERQRRHAGALADAGSGTSGSCLSRRSATGVPSPAPKSTSGIPRRRVSTKTRIPIRPR